VSVDEGGSAPPMVADTVVVTVICFRFVAGWLISQTRL
jgi:hypothetical protein